MTPTQCREARALLKWSRDRLAANCEESRRTVERYENYGRVPPRSRIRGDIDPIAVIRAAFEAAGVEFIEINGDARGVRLRRSASL